MKNRLSALAAGTALCAIMAAPASAGYTIYVDTALPSVLFVEFDAPPAGEEEARAVSAPGAPAPVVITGPGASGSPGPSTASGRFVGNDGGQSTEESSSSEEIDLNPTPQNLVEDAVRDQVFEDIQLR